MKLFLDKSNLGGHSLSEANVDKDASITIETTSLDDRISFKAWAGKRKALGPMAIPWLEQFPIIG